MGKIDVFWAPASTAVVLFTVLVAGFVMKGKEDPSSSSSTDLKSNSVMSPGDRLNATPDSRKGNGALKIGESMLPSALSASSCVVEHRPC